VAHRREQRDGECYYRKSGKQEQDERRLRRAETRKKARDQRKNERSSHAEYRQRQRQGLEG
jgi:hypothetical protein